MSDFRINGIIPDWYSIEWAFPDAGAVPPILKELSFKEKLSRKKVYGSPRHPVGRTGGKVEPDGSFTCLLVYYLALIKALGNGFGLVEFNINASIRMRSTIEYATFELIQCCIIEPDFSPSEGEDPLEVKVGLDIMRIRHNGLYMVDPDVPV